MTSPLSEHPSHMKSRSRYSRWFESPGQQVISTYSISSLLLLFSNSDFTVLPSKRTCRNSCLLLRQCTNIRYHVSFYTSICTHIRRKWLKFQDYRTLMLARTSTTHAHVCQRIFGNLPDTWVSAEVCFCPGLRWRGQILWVLYTSFKLYSGAKP
jgi:hypothetical protein